MSNFDPKALAEMTALNERLSAVLDDQSKPRPDHIADRLARLEGRVDKVWEDHSETKRLTSVLEERIKHLPTKPDLWRALTALFVGVTGVIAFAEKIQGLLK